MAFKFVGCNFIGNGIGIKAHSGTEIHVDTTTFSRNGSAVVIYDSKDELLKELFKPGVPRDVIESAAEALRQAQETEYPSILERYEIGKWLKAGADLSTIVANIMSLF